ncbi:hypothetical protein PIB30_084403, partial [Stylosanthes scabra]|nr:hypothetical protein [Stylosanthes scabra]
MALIIDRYWLAQIPKFRKVKEDSDSRSTGVEMRMLTKLWRTIGRFKLKDQILKKCRHEIVKWQALGANNNKELMKQVKERLSALKTHPNEADKDEILRLEEQLTETYCLEEWYWREKSRANWLKWGVLD